MYDIPIFTIGEKIRDWTVLTQLARTGLSGVYEVFKEDPHSDASIVCALKITRPLYEIGLSLGHEAAIMRAYGEHPSLPRLWEAWDDGGLDYLVMDHIDAPCLGTVCNKWIHPISKARAKETLIAILEILAYLHAREPPIYHLDVKPTNLFVRREYPLELTLIDFGISCNLDSVMWRPREGTVAGTPLYLDPQQWQGRSYLPDGRSDVYAVGVIGFRLLGGQINHQQMLPLTSKLSEAVGSRYGKLSSVVNRAIEWDPNARFQSIAEFLEAVQNT